MNRKGFIATSILYGIVALLSITLMMILSNYEAERKSNKAAKDIINNVSNKTSVSTTFFYKPEIQKYVVPKTGTYSIKVYGAEGGKINDLYPGGEGAVVEGKMDLTKGQILYISVGGSGAEGGYNGGGRSDTDNGAVGGGASDIRTTENTDSRIIVAGGGGSGNNERRGLNGGNLTNTRLTTSIEGETGPIGGGGGGYLGGLAAVSGQFPAAGGSSFVSPIIKNPVLTEGTHIGDGLIQISLQ